VIVEALVAWFAFSIPVFFLLLGCLHGARQ
jgi:hypothetical protein